VSAANRERRRPDPPTPERDPGAFDGLGAFAGIRVGLVPPDLPVNLSIFLFYEERDA
jgi:hypothetical protein